MGVLSDLQSAVLDDNVALSALLRKAKVLAVELRSNELEQWVDQELGGYGNIPVEQLPAYRKGATQSIGDFVGPFNSGYRNLPLSTAHLQEPIIDQYANSYELREGVKELEILARSESGATIPWPPDVVAAVGHAFVPHHTLASARKILPPAASAGVLDAIRNRLLALVLELRKRHPDSPDDEIVKKASVEEVRQITNVVIGDHNVVAIGQEIEQRVIAGDIQSLIATLSSLGLGGNDIEEVLSAITQDRKDKESPTGLGRRVMSWVQSAARNVGSLSFDVAKDVLAKIVAAYLGVDR